MRDGIDSVSRNGVLGDQRPANALEPDDIARIVMFTLAQPPHVDVNEVLVRPTSQSL